MNRARLKMLAALPLLTIAAGVAIAPLRAQQQPVPRITYGPLELRGYELREHAFDPPFRIPQRDGTVEQKKFGWQIVIKGTNFPVRALDPILWVDDVELIRYERCNGEDGNSLVFSFFDPALLRSEHVLQVIYGKDERTRTKLLERLDPEKLVRLPDAQRQALGMPELESFTLKTVTADGHVEADWRLHGSVNVVIAARLESGALHVMAGTSKLEESTHRYVVDVGAFPNGTTYAVALLQPEGVRLSGDLADLPKGVELLDSKPIGTKPAGR
jgi:hypothetical protein